MPRSGLLLALTAWVGSFVPTMAAEPVASAPAPDAGALRAYAAQVTRELRTDILPFWLKHARDEQRGGFVGRIASDMTVERDAPRGTLLTSRILWTFSAAYRRFHAPEYLAMARWAFRDLTEHGFDRENGGLFWTTKPDGSPADVRKIIYDQSFGLYGLTEYHRATGDGAALEQAIALYRLIEDKARDHAQGGYFETFTRDWQRDESGQRQILGGKGPKSQNTHIHLLEAYTALLRVWPDVRLRRDLRDLLSLMLTRIINPRTHHLGLFFRDDWTPIGEEISYGHDIELSWLVVEAAQVLGDPALLNQAKAVALQMAAVTLREGIDTDGAVLNEGDPRGITNPNKDWWPQAEATVGFLNAYELSGDVQFYTASRRTWAFIEDKLIDRQNGDWYESVARDGTPRPGSKLSVWKCPYHNSRACLEILARCEERMISEARNQN